MRRFVLIFALVLLGVLILLPRRALADFEFDPRTTPADAQRLRDLIAKCEGELESFRELTAAIRRSDRPVRVFPGRDQPGIYVDAFGTGEIDLSDLEKYANPLKDRETGRFVFPLGVDPQAATLCQNLAHILYERFHANYVGGRFEPSHDAANGYESRIRREFGQTGSLIDIGTEGGDAVWVYTNSTFIIQRDKLTARPDGSVDVGPIGTTTAKVICAGACAGPPPRRRVVAGADTCDDCERALVAQCGGPLTGSACRTR